jgi:HK97 family phage major capsid protein
MSLAVIKKLREDKQALALRQEPLLAALEQGTLTAEQDAELGRFRTELRSLDDRIGELMAEETRRLQAAARDVEFDELQAEHAARPAPRLHGGTSPAGLGIDLAASPEYRALLAGDADSTGLLTVRLADITTGSGVFPLAGYFRARDPRGPSVYAPLLEAVGYEQVTSGSYFYEDWSKLWDWIAGEVPEGGLKPEMPGEPEVKTGTLTKAAAWKAVTTEALEDIPAIQSKIEGVLLRAVLRKAESLTGEALADATVPTDSGAPTSGGLLAAVRSGIAQVQDTGYPANDVALNPRDAGQLDLDLLGKLIGGGAQRDTPVWGLRVVQTRAIPAGTAYVGSLVDAVTVYARSDAQVRIGHKNDDLVRNKVTIVAEQRMAAHVTDPMALVKVVATP